MGVKQKTQSYRYAKMPCHGNPEFLRLWGLEALGVLLFYDTTEVKTMAAAAFREALRAQPRGRY